MKEFRCGDIVRACDEVITYETLRELMPQIVRHAGRDHDAKQLLTAASQLPRRLGRRAG